MYINCFPSPNAERDTPLTGHTCPNRQQRCQSLIRTAGPCPKPWLRWPSLPRSQPRLLLAEHVAGSTLDGFNFSVKNLRLWRVQAKISGYLHPNGSISSANNESFAGYLSSANLSRIWFYRPSSACCCWRPLQLGGWWLQGFRCPWNNGVLPHNFST